MHVASLDMQEEDILQDDAWVVISAFFEEKVSIMVVDAQYVLRSHDVLSIQTR